MDPIFSIFLEFSLPNATTWFYFSWLLAVALFFKFSRLLSIRNWDVVTVFLLMPGFLVLQKTRVSPEINEQHPAVQITELVGQGVGGALGVPTAIGWIASPNRHPVLTSTNWL